MIKLEFSEYKYKKVKNTKYKHMFIKNNKSNPKQNIHDKQKLDEIKFCNLIL